MTHGTYGCYRNHECRCRLCRDAAAAYIRARRAQLKTRGRCTECTAPIPPATFRRRAISRCEDCRRTVRARYHRNLSHEATT